jgi:hypothetical protein
MTATPAPPAKLRRVRIFVDFRNFSLSLRRADSGFMVDWRPVPARHALC